MRPRIFFDTSFCIDIARGRITADEWTKCRQSLTRQFQYCISPLTLYELLVGFSRGRDQYFEPNKEALRVLYGNSANRLFLKLPGQFVMETVLKVDKRKFGFEAKDFDLWTKAALRAPDIQSLESGAVEMPPRKSRTFGLDLGLIEAQVQEGKDAHARELEELRDGKLQAPPSVVWAAGIIRRMEGPPRPELCKSLATALDAAYRFDSALWKLASESKYDFEKHASDWIDVQQLYYLSDTRMNIVTRDVNYNVRTLGSTQADRILVYDGSLKVFTS